MKARAVPWGLGLVAAGISLVVFSRQASWSVGPPGGNDFSQHLAFAAALCRGGGMQPHFLLELVVCGLAALLPGARAFAVALVAVATAAVVAKALLTYRRIGEAGSPRGAFFGALGLLLAMPLFNWWRFPDVYLGQVTPNVWHNPTAIAVLPLAFLLFEAAARWTGTERPSAIAGVAALGLLTCLTKPNYLLALFPCWGILLAVRSCRAAPAGPRGWRRGLRTALAFAAVAGPAVVVLAWQAVRFNATGGGIALDPLAVWRLYSPNLPASILLGIAFPLGVLALHFRAARRQASLLFAWSVLLVAVLQMALLAEPGQRFVHGNYFWGAYTANYLLFVESAAVLAAAPRSWRSVAAWSLLLAHALVGGVYIVRLVMGLAVL